MKKIPTLFERDWSGDRSRVTPEVHPGCEWVIDGEGVATQKHDGTSCMVRGNRLFKRRELREGDPIRDDFEPVGFDKETKKMVGWVPVGDGPEDRWHREAFAGGGWDDGTYELIGPKVQGNPEQTKVHVLVSHGGDKLPDAPRTFEGLRDWLATQDVEGVVWHHPDGRMAKIKLRDFGHKRGR